MDLLLKWKTWNCKILENIGKSFLVLVLMIIFFWYNTENTETIIKINKWDYINLKISAPEKKNNQQNEMAVYGMRENMCKLYSC